MKNQIIDTLIIGAGVAGLGCAHELQKHKKDFLIISETIGGRILESDENHINYGAYFVLSNYKHILPFVKKGEKLHPFFVEFHDSKRHFYHLFKMFDSPSQSFRLAYMLLRFKSKYEWFKKQCEKRSQKEVIESDSTLKKLYLQTAYEFVKEKKILDIAQRFLAQGIYMCTFLPLSQISAFDFMRLCMGLILPAYEFVFLPEKATANFKDKILVDTVMQVKNGEVTTKSRKRFKANNIVIATPTPVAQKLLGFEKSKSGANAYVFHVAGLLKDKWKHGQFELFGSTSEVIFIRKQQDGTYIFYSKTPNPKLELYFVDPEIIFEKHWEPAFNITGTELLACEQGSNLYLAGDHNVIGLEDSYISGMCAAHTLMKQKKRA